ncbi:aspartate ammonia-lyase [Corynebacterium sp. H130]|uniref:aspartate ammonia-lyase n=1 Tax=Corynebacterium sp. H130 TaxID=3133444 RepID=UPI00403F0D28
MTEVNFSEGTRIEEDLLGTKEVSNEFYYGVHTLRAVENFVISGKTHNEVPDFIRGMVQVKKATAMANRACKTLPKDKYEAIVWACDQILEEGRCMDQFPTDAFQGGAGTSMNMNTNEVVANLALEHMGKPKGSYHDLNPNDDVNMAQSTNDAYPTGLKLGIFHAATTYVAELRNLAEAFKAKGEEFKNVLKMGRTQLQDAVPMTLGGEFYAFGHGLSEEADFIENAIKILLTTNLGATAIGTGLNTPDGFQDAIVKALAEVTGLEIKGAPDLLVATYDNSCYMHAHSAIKQSAMNLSKICNDLRLLASGPRAGLKEINLPEMQAGSSIMPAKVNPVIPEVVNQVCFKVFGNDTCVLMSAEAGQLQLNVMEPALAQAIFESIELLTNAVITLREKCVVGITANEDICRAFVDNSIGIITYLNPFIGHLNGDKIGKEAAETGRSVRDLVLEKGLMDEEKLNEVLSVENLMNPVYRGKLYED